MIIIGGFTANLEVGEIFLSDFKDGQIIGVAHIKALHCLIVVEEWPRKVDASSRMEFDANKRQRCFGSL